MNIALLNVKVTFQESVVTVDAVGNTVNTWQDKYTCHATVSGESGKETLALESTLDRSSITFAVRYSSYTKNIDSTTHRIKFNGEFYDITSVDHLNYKRKGIKISARKERP